MAAAGSEGGRSARRGKKKRHDLLIETWATCVAEGIPDELYWQLTPPERLALLEKLRERRKEERLLFGLVAATIENSRPGRARRAKQPGDYFTTRRAGPPVSAEDRKRLAHLMIPSRSIRA